jgi:orotate phosphoribosyltransferase
MIFNTNTAQQTAELLLQINAIKLNSKNPFTWASGWKSPIYCDNRIILSFPAVRNYIRDEFAKQIEDKFGKPDVIAGVATGAIGIGILVAEAMGLPFVYVRPETKKTRSPKPSGRLFAKRSKCNRSRRFNFNRWK